LKEQPLGFQFFLIVRLEGKKNVRAMKKGRSLFPGSTERAKPERSEDPREQEVPPRSNPLGSVKGYGFSSGSKSLERQMKAVKFSYKAQERNIEGKAFDGSLERSKALKGKAQECRELKEAFKGLKSCEAVKRVAKP